MDPPPSEPVASGTMPAASAAAAPPDDPPAPWAGLNGLAVGPNRALVVLPDQANSGRLVLPTTTHPAARRRATKGLSAVAGGRVGQDRCAEGGAVAHGVVVVLDRQRDAGQWSGIAALGRDLVDGGGLRQCPLGIDGDEGVVGGVEGRRCARGRAVVSSRALIWRAAHGVGQLGQGCGAEVAWGSSRAGRSVSVGSAGSSRA